MPHDDPNLPSEGGRPTEWADEQLQRFMADGSEIPPDMVEEQKAVLLKPGDVVNNRFEVVDQLGFGGMGAVYRVKDLQLGAEDKALKVMLPSLLKNEHARERFYSEVSISQKLRHEDIVTVYDLGEDRDRGFRFFTMEYVEGKTLHRVLNERGGKLPVDEALGITRQICDALEYAHRTTIHRDLKPQNVMVRPDGSIKVLDFGLAKLMSPGRMTKSSMALGTAYYQAPEQSIHLQELDPRADIYSLGVVLYELLTGELPVGALSPPSHVVRGVPKYLDDVVMRCLQPKPENRYADVGALRDALGGPRGSGKRSKLMPAIAVAAVVVLVAAGAFLFAAPSRHVGPQPGGLENQQVENTTPAGPATQSPTSQPGGTPESPAEPPGPPDPSVSVPALSAEKTQRLQRDTAPNGEITKTIDLGGGVTMELVWVPPGEFMMGSEEYSDEEPVHKVRISKGFWMGKHEVTQKQWQAVMGSNPSNSEGDSNPVEQVSWDDCQEFLKKAGGGLRLPTGAEWEYACRAGSRTKYCFGDDEGRLGDYAWYSSNSGSKTHPVGQKKANAWGLYDMHGNVLEWCQDWYGEDYYASSPTTDPRGPTSGSGRVLRGGGWDLSPWLCRSASRLRSTPVRRSNGLGFRVVLPVGQ